MTRILVFGDSQVATVAVALKQFDVTKSNARFDFVCAHGPVAHKLCTNGHKLYLTPVPNTWNHAHISDDRLNEWHGDTQAQIAAISDGADTVDLTDFDVLVCTGGHILARWNILHDVVTSPFLSSACIEQTCLDTVSEMPHGRWLLGLINSPHRGSVSMFSLPEPLLNEMSPLITTPAYAGKHFGIVQEVIVRALRQLGSTFIPVPDELISSSGNCSPAKYKVDRKDDYVHLNHDGGNSMLRSLIRALETPD